MADNQKQVPAFDDSADGITQFVFPSIDGDSVQSGVTSLQESPLLELPISNGSAQCIQILGDNGEIQYIQLLPEQQEEQIAVGDSSGFVDMGNSEATNEVQLVQTGDGGIIYLSSESGISTEALQDSETLCSDSNIESVVGLQDGVTKTLSGNDVQQFVHEIEGQNNQLDSTEDISVAQSHGQIFGSNDIGHHITSNPQTKQPGVISDQNNTDTYLTYNPSNTGTVLGPSINASEFIYLQKTISSAESVIPASLMSASNAPVTSGITNSNMPVKVIKIPQSMHSIDSIGDLVSAENLTSNAQSSAPVKVISLPPGGSFRPLSGGPVTINPFSVSTGINNVRQLSKPTDSISVKIVPETQTHGLANTGVTRNGESVISSILNSGSSNVQVPSGQVTSDIKVVSVYDAAAGGSLQTVTHSEGTTTVSMGQNQDSTPPLEHTQEKKEAIDLNQPIELTSHTVVTVNGKKCLLRVDPSSKHLVAYPVKPEVPKRPRGRPRKPKADEVVNVEDEGPVMEPAEDMEEAENEEQWSEDTSDVQTERESHALEGLLGLSDIDGRRKSLRSKKKPKTLVDEYETGAIDGVDEDDSAFVDNPSDKDVSIPQRVLLQPGEEGQGLTDHNTVVITGINKESRRGRGRPRGKMSAASQTKNQLHNYLANLGLPGIKRGRGRPRRSLPDGVTGPVRAYVIPSSNGQTVVMATTQDNQGVPVTTSLTPKVLPATLPDIVTGGVSMTTVSNATSAVSLTSSMISKTIATPAVHMSAVKSESLVTAVVKESQVSSQAKMPKVTIITADSLNKHGLPGATLPNSQGMNTNSQLPDTKALQPTVIPVIRSLASGNITMTTATLSKKPESLKAEDTTSSTITNSAINDATHPKTVVNLASKIDVNNQTSLSSVKSSVPTPIFTVDPKKGSVPIIVRCVDSTSGQVTLKRLGGADNKLSQGIMSGHKMDILNKGIKVTVPTPLVKTALDGTLTVLYQKEKDTPEEDHIGDGSKEPQPPTQELVSTSLTEEPAVSTADVIDLSPQEEEMEVGDCQHADSDGGEEDGEIDVVTQDTVVVEEEGVEDGVNICTQITGETHQIQIGEQETEEEAAVDVEETSEDEVVSHTQHDQKPPPFQVTFLPSLSDSNLVILNSDNKTDSEDRKPLITTVSASVASEAVQLTAANEENSEPLSAGEEEFDESEDKGSLGETTIQAQVIQLPQDVMPVVLNKQSVQAAIGLRSTEEALVELKCSKCEFQAFYERQYREHIATHTEASLHYCKCCKFVSFTKEELISHFKKVHPKLICSVCDFMAEHKYTIKRHMQRHDPEGISCELCGKKYKDQYILKIHIKMVHMPAEVLFECEVCQKKFTRKAHLKRHMRTHDPEKPFKCPHCDYRGCERSDITKHVVIHDEPKFWCEVCGKHFRHIKNKELHLKRHRGQRDYKCGVCDFYGYTFTDIRKHIERKHAEHRNIMCQNCGCKFRNEAMLKDHSKYCCEMLLVEPGVFVASQSEVGLGEGGEELRERGAGHQVLGGAVAAVGGGHYMGGETAGTVMEEQVSLSDEVSVTFGGQCIGSEERLDMMDTSLSEMAGHHHPVASGDFVTVSQDQSLNGQGLEGQVISIGGLEVAQRISEAGYDVYGATADDDLTVGIAGGAESMAINM